MFVNRSSKIRHTGPLKVNMRSFTRKCHHVNVKFALVNQKQLTWKKCETHHLSLLVQSRRPEDSTRSESGTSHDRLHTPVSHYITLHWPRGADPICRQRWTHQTLLMIVTTILDVRPTWIVVDTFIIKLSCLNQVRMDCRLFSWCPNTRFPEPPSHVSKGTEKKSFKGQRGWKLNCFYMVD